MESTNNYIETDLGNVSPNPKGTYDNATAYEYLDLVEYQGGSYLCTVDIGKKVKGISPTAGQNSETWQLVALPGTSTEEYVAKHTEVIEKAKQVETSRAAVELCKQEVESAQADVEQMRQDTQQVAQNASDANTEAQQAAQQAEASRSAAQTSEQNAAASRDLANTYKANAETAKSAAETAAQEANESKTAAETAAQNAAQSKADIDSIKADIEEAAKGENVSQIQKNMNDIGQLKESVSNKITKFYASNQGETHITDSDSGKIQDMMIYGKSEQKQYKGINLLPPDTKLSEYVEVSIPKGSSVFLTTDGTLSNGGNLKFFNEDKTKSIWLGIDTGTTSAKQSLTIDVKYVQNLINASFDLSKICLGVGSEPIYEPYTGGIPSPSPDYPQEIKSVVNPKVKVCGKNLWNPILKGYINNTNGSITKTPKASVAVTDFIKKSGKDITVIARNFSSAMENSYAYRIGLYDVRKKWIKNIIPSDGNKYSINTFNVIGTEYIRVSAPSGVYDTIQIEKGSEATSYEPYTDQSVQLPCTLNAIPVSSGGNVTIDGQQYIADYVDVERGKVVRMCERGTFNTKNGEIDEEYRLAIDIDINAQNSGNKECIFSAFKYTNWGTCVAGTKLYIKNIKKSNNELYTAQELKELSLDFDCVYQLLEQQETDLTAEQTQAFKALATYYPTTNISVNSEQLDGYTVFNYPISMANGWNYVKQQLNDNRDYIYDTDLQSAEAYVNSEYAVALTELEVM